MYAGTSVTVTVLIALLVCLIPTTIGALLSAIGIAGIDRLLQRNVLAMSGRAVEAAGDVDTLLLDKTGTITLGNRQAAEFVPRRGWRDEPPVRAATWPASPTRPPRAARSSPWRGGSGSRRGRQHLDLRPLLGDDPDERRRPRREQHPQGRRRQRRGVVLTEGSADVICPTRREQVEPIARCRRHAAGGRRGSKVLGAIHLKDIVKPGISERFAEMRRWACAR